MTKILATSIHILAKTIYFPAMCVRAHTHRETKQTSESKPEYSACTSHERFPIWGPFTVEGTGQEIRGRVTILFVFKMSGLTRWQVFKLMFIFVQRSTSFLDLVVFSVC